jgi:putative acyl-CoA dehydrogenase
MPATGSSNHPDDLVDYNLFASNAALVDAAEREGAAAPYLQELGERFGTRRLFELGDAANRNPPVLKAFDRFGQRRDEVEFHPAWHELMRLQIAAGLLTSPWAEPTPTAHVTRAAAYMLWAEIENGTQCPATMTYGAVPALARQSGDFADWMPKLLSREYDGRLLPIVQKQGALMGMGMTEKQGGSDVRSNSTRAERAGPGGVGGEYRLCGHKWFFSAPMCDAFLVLAQAPGGLSCFFVPRVLPDGTRNPLCIQRLKDKLGNRSNASSEVEFDGTHGLLVGEEGRGIPTILEMGVFTRLDCAIASAGIMRQCVSQAIHHARHRSAFGKLLIDQPLMRNVLADLAVECEAAIALAIRLAHAFDSREDPESALRRVLTPVAKYWICKRGPAVGTESMEVLGGNGYVEEGPIARRYRELPLNSIWEGSGNIMCLDVMRALAREPRALESLATLWKDSGGRDPRFDRYSARLLDGLRGGDISEANARALTERIALATQGAILLQGRSSVAAEAFLSSRIATGAPGAFGVLPVASCRELIERIHR